MASHTRPPIRKHTCGANMLLTVSGYWVCPECKDSRILPASYEERRRPVDILPREVTERVCPECDGYGWQECEACDGTGEDRCPECGHSTGDCWECDGEGLLDCDKCDGTGWIKVADRPGIE